MKKIPFNLNWERVIGEKRSLWQVESNPAVQVNLPDDFIINLPRKPDSIGGAATGFFTGGRAVYTKSFDVPEEWEGKTVLLDIDGAYMNAEVTLNGEALGVHPYGYTPWQINLNNAIIPGEKNDIEIVTRCIQPDSRWYTGGGLYREINLWVGESCHIRPWDLFVCTKKADNEHALLHVSAVITNALEHPAQGSFSISLCGETVTVPVSVPACETTRVELEINVKNPKLWSAKEPNLHELTAVVQTDLGKDVMATQIGIRKIEFDSTNGMRVNGEPVKLLGGCIHHDNSLLGAAAYPRAEERKIELLKSL